MYLFPRFPILDEQKVEARSRNFSKSRLLCEVGEAQHRVDMKVLLAMKFSFFLFLGLRKNMKISKYIPIL